MVEADTRYEILKVSPLIEWTRVATLDFARANNVLLNTLQDKGFTSSAAHLARALLAPASPSVPGGGGGNRAIRKSAGFMCARRAQLASDSRRHNSYDDRERIVAGLCAAAIWAGSE